MTQVKTSELIDTALDWAVAKSRGFDVYHNAMLNGHVMRGFWVSGYYPGDLNIWVPLERYNPSTDWAQGGPIIERENISVLPPIVRRIGAERHAFSVEHWRSLVCRDENELAVHGHGPTPLIAAMRCLVASKLGDVVEIPDELHLS